MTDRPTIPTAERRRLSALEAVNEAVQLLLRAARWSDPLEEAMRRIAQAFGADHAFLFQNFSAADQNLHVTLRQAYHPPDLPLALEPHVLNDLDLAERGLTGWQASLASGKVVHGGPADFALAEAAFLQQAGIQAVALAPIFTGERWWGVFGLDRHTSAAAFSPHELELMQLISATLGLVIHWRETEHRLRQITSSLLDLVLQVDCEGIIHYASPSSCAQLGYAPDELQGRPVFELLHPDDLLNFQAVLSEMLQNGADRQLDHRLRAQTGDYLAVETSLSALLDQDGAVAGAVLASRNLSTRLETERELREARALAEALRDTTAALTGTLKLDEVLSRILDNVGRVVPSECANIMLIQPDGLAHIVRAVGYDRFGTTDYVMNVRYRVKEVANLEKMLRTRAPMAIPDVRGEASWITSEPLTWIRSYAAAPLRLHGEVIGFLNLDSATPNAYSLEHAERLQAFADQAAVAIQNARLYEDAHERARQQDLLNQITHLALATPDLNAMLTLVAQRLLQLFHAANVHVVLWESENTPYMVATAAAAPLSGGQHLDLSTMEPALEAVRRGEKLVIEDIRDSKWVPPPLAEWAGPASLAAVPLAADGRVIGGMMISQPEPHRFAPTELALVDQAASQVALAVSKVLLLEKVRRSAITDDVTGLYNRRGWNELGRREIKRARRFHRPLSCILMDLDHFKLINDSYGHHTGDEVLKAVGQVLQQGLREVDLLARWGGDEYVILLPENDLESGVAVAERLRHAVSANPYPTPYGDLALTASFGVADLTPDLDDLVDLVDAADRAMYVAKQSGRNRTAQR